VEGLVLDRLQPGLADGVEDQLAGDLGARQRRGVGDVELHAALGELPATAFCFIDALLGQPDVAPAGEQVLQIPFALTVPNEDECAGHCYSFLPARIASSTRVMIAIVAALSSGEVSFMRSSGDSVLFSAER